MSTPPPGLERSSRVYARLFSLYPARFRREYGADALGLFRDRYREAYMTRGVIGLAALWGRTLPNVLLHGALEHLARGGGDSNGPHPLGQALRTIARNPGPSATMVVTLALGIGSTVAIFGVLRGVLLRPLPFEGSERLVAIQEENPTLAGGAVGVSPLNFADWDGQVDGFEAMTAWYLTSGTYRTDIAAEEVRMAQVTADFFGVLGAEAAVGRTFRREEVVGYGPLVLGYALWQRLYGGDPAVIGTRVEISGTRYEVVGVMPADFRYPDPSVEAWLAWDMAAVYADRQEARTWRFLKAAGRVADGVPHADAGRSLERRAASLALAYPEADRGWTVRIDGLRDSLVGDVRGTLWVAFGAVTLLLLIACTNVANLLLARVPARSRDLAIRASLGASGRRLLTDLVMESLVLATLAGALGLALGSVFLDVLVSLDVGRIPRLEEVGIDGWVLGFTLVVTVATSVVFGAAPALQTLGASALASLRDGTRTSASRAQRITREVFVAAQVAVALVLLTGAGFLQASLVRAAATDPGFDSSGVATFRVSLDSRPGDATATVRYYAQLLEDVAALPGVLAVGASQTLPMDAVAGDFERPYRAAGASTPTAEAPVASMRIVTPGYIRAMGMRLLQGSDFDGTEELTGTASAPGEPWVAIVNRGLARRLWPDGDAVGKTFELDWQRGWSPYTVVGVVDDVLHGGPRGGTTDEVYVSHRQVPYLAMSVVVRTTGDPEALTPALRRVTRSQERAQPAYNFVTLDDLRGGAVAEERFMAVLVEIFSVIALMLACSGVYGVVSYAVSHRTREIGVRMALGAQPRAVVREVLVKAAATAGGGAVAGLVLVRFGGGVLDGVLYGIEASDLRPTLIGAAIMLSVASVAAIIPARRAARIPPTAALRSD